MHEEERPSPRDEILKTDTRGRVRVSPERRQQLLDECDRSGLSAAQFTALHQINYQTFMGWRKKRRGQQANKRSVKALPSKVEFREVVVGQAPESVTALEIEIAGDIRLRINNQKQAALAADFIRQLHKPN